MNCKKRRSRVIFDRVGVSLEANGDINAHAQGSSGSLLTVNPAMISYLLAQGADLSIQ